MAGTALKVYQWYVPRPLWLDEEMVLLNVRDRGFSELLQPLWLDQAAPIGWLTLQKLIVVEFGTSDRTVRTLPILFGIATLWVAVSLAVRWMKPAGATIFILLLAIGQWMAYYALETKPYSADALFALAVPALAIWACEPTGARVLSLRRTLAWWIFAALAQWFAFGAIFVTPACAIVLCGLALRRGGWRLASAVALQGFIWLALFGVHYAVTLSHASNDEFLRNYWAWGFPPAGTGVSGTLKWLAMQLPPLAGQPGGTTWWIAFWGAAACGIALALSRQPAAGLMLLAVCVSGFALAGLRRVPLADRLALWIFPSIYAAIALAVDYTIDEIRSWSISAHKVRPALAGAFLVLLAVLCVDIVNTGRKTMVLGGDNHGLDDRRAVRFLMNQRQPGDVLLTTRFGFPAVWWYGDIPVSEPNRGRVFPQDEARLFELVHVWPDGPGCRGPQPPNHLARVLTGTRRALVHLGFASRIPPGFQELVLDELSALGTLVSYRETSELGVVAIFDLQLTNPEWDPKHESQIRRELKGGERLAGCVGIHRARRW